MRALLAENQGGVSLVQTFRVDPAMHGFDGRALFERYLILARLVSGAAERHFR